MRTDPTDNGGLFVGRRPGTAPVRYRALPQPGSATRRRIDRVVAHLVLAGMVLVNLLFWGPIPAGGLWVAAQVQYRTDNVGLALLVGFAVILAALMLGLMVLKRIDELWVLVRRAAGYDQRNGVLGTVFAVTCVIGATCFTVWLLGVAGPGPTLAPSQ